MLLSAASILAFARHPPGVVVARGYLFCFHEVILLSERVHLFVHPVSSSVFVRDTPLVSGLAESPRVAISLKTFFALFSVGWRPAGRSRPGNVTNPRDVVGGGNGGR